MKYTDDEVIKALEICTKSKRWGDCEDMGCPAATKHGCYFYLRTAEDYEGVVQDELLKDALALINRQKAEIERLKKIGDYKTSEVLRHDASIRELHKQLETTKSEAIKEFAWRLKNRLTPYPEAPFCEMVGSLDIDALVEEMTEEQTNES